MSVQRCQPKRPNDNRQPAGVAAAVESPWPADGWPADFRRRLLAWYRRNARDLPWRGTLDPYRVWVSEIMLQQTQVATVEAYFRRFVARLPSIASLAAAPEDTVLRLWEGLGYYRRARQMHRAARIIVAEHDGEFPRDAAAVRRLPGIGRYTAGAILSIAFDQAEPILEANTVRLLARLLGYRGDPRSALGQGLLWQAAEALLPRRGAGQLNQALMELGSQVCRPRNPDCPSCPVAALCPTGPAGLHAEIPLLRPKPRFEELREAAFIIRRRGRVLLIRRRDGERWAGLWDFPRLSLGAPRRAAEGDDLARQVLVATTVRIEPPRLLTTLRHGVTRFRITLDCYEADARATSRRRKRDPAAESRWVPIAELADYPLNTTGRKLAQLAAKRGESIRLTPRPTVLAAAPASG